MQAFHRAALETACRDAAFAGLFAIILMIGFSFHLPLAFLIGGNVAIAFALAHVYRATRLTDERIARSEPWRTLPPRQRPSGETDRRSAIDTLQEVWLRSARAAAATAVMLMALSLVASAFHGAPSHAFAPPEKHTIVTAQLR